MTNDCKSLCWVYQVLPLIWILPQLEIPSLILILIDIFQFPQSGLQYLQLACFQLTSTPGQCLFTVLIRELFTSLDLFNLAFSLLFFYHIICFFIHLDAIFQADAKLVLLISSFFSLKSSLLQIGSSISLISCFPANLLGFLVRFLRADLTASFCFYSLVFFS